MCNKETLIDVDLFQGIDVLKIMYLIYYSHIINNRFYAPQSWSPMIDMQI